MHCLGRVESWAMWGSDSDSPRSSWRGGLCERTGPSLYGGSGRIEQEDYLKNKRTLGGSLGNYPTAAAPVSSPPSHPAFPWGCAGH